MHRGKRLWENIPKKLPEVISEWWFFCIFQISKIKKIIKSWNKREANITLYVNYTLKIKKKNKMVKTIPKAVFLKNFFK